MKAIRCFTMGCIAVLAVTVFLSLPAAAATNEEVTARINELVANGTAFKDAVSMVSEELLREALDATATDELNQETVETIIAGIMTQFAEIQQSGALESEIAFEDVYAGILNGAVAISGFEFDPTGLDAAASQSWQAATTGDTPAPGAEAYERARQQAFQIRAREMNQVRVQDSNPASPQ